MVKRKVQKTGTGGDGSLYAVIPKAIAEHFNLKIGDVLDFRIEDDHIKALIVR